MSPNLFLDSSPKADKIFNNLTTEHKGTCTKNLQAIHLMHKVCPSLMVITEHGVRQKEIKHAKMTGYTVVTEQ